MWEIDELKTNREEVRYTIGGTEKNGNNFHIVALHQEADYLIHFLEPISETFGCTRGNVNTDNVDSEKAKYVAFPSTYSDHWIAAQYREGEDRLYLINVCGIYDDPVAIPLGINAVAALKAHVII